MDTSSVLIGVTLLLLFSGPVAYLVLSQSLQGKKQRKQLAAFLAQSKLNATQTDFLPGLSIGFDQALRKLVVVSGDLLPQNHLIDLNEIKGCEVSSLSGPPGAKDVDALTQVNLVLQRKTKGQPSERILFYQEGVNSVTEKEFLLNAARKWQKLLHQFLQN